MSSFCFHRWGSRIPGKEICLSCGIVINPVDVQIMAAIELIGSERIRQIEAEGFSATHDEAHDEGERFTI